MRNKKLRTFANQALLCVLPQDCILIIFTLMEEGEVFFDNWEERDDWRLQVLAVENISVLGHVSGRVKQVLQITEELLVLARKFLPSSSQSGHRCQI